MNLGANAHSIATCVSMRPEWGSILGTSIPFSARTKTGSEFACGQLINLVIYIILYHLKSVPKYIITTLGIFILSLNSRKAHQSKPELSRGYKFFTFPLSHG